MTILDSNYDMIKYIFQGMNLEKRTNVKFVDQKKLKTHTRSTKLISAEPINLEAKIFEVRKRKVSILDKIPVQSAAMILSSAKLHFIDFVSDLAEYMDPQAFRIIYMGKKYHIYDKIKLNVF